MILGMTRVGDARPHFQQRLKMGAAHALGGMVGGALIAGAVFLACTPIRTLLGLGVARALAAFIILIAAALDLGLLRWNGPGGQVDPGLRAMHGPTRSYFIYGVKFGIGALTLRPSAVYYSALAVIGLVLPLAFAIAAGILFGLGRTALVYPSSFHATQVSLVLSRGRYAHRAWRTVGTVISSMMFASLYA